MKDENCCSFDLKKLLKTNLISYVSLFKKTILRAQNDIEVFCSHGKFGSSSNQIVNFPLKNITVFTIDWLARIKFAGSFVNHFKMIEISFQFQNLIFQLFDSAFQPIIQPFQSIVGQGQYVCVFMGFKESLKK